MTKEEIQTKYIQLCGQVGDLNYRLNTIPGELQKLYAEMIDLNQQNAKLVEEEKNAATAKKD